MAQRAKRGRPGPRPRRAHNGRRVREAAPYRVRIFVGAPFGRLRAARGRPYGGAGSAKVTGYRGGYDPTASGKGKGRGQKSPAFWRLSGLWINSGYICNALLHVQTNLSQPYTPHPYSHTPHTRFAHPHHHNPLQFHRYPRHHCPPCISEQYLQP